MHVVHNKKQEPLPDPEQLEKAATQAPLVADGDELSGKELMTFWKFNTRH